MARRSSGKRQRSLKPTRRPEVLGVVLLVLALITGLSLVSLSRGSVTEQWLQFLRRLVGWGTYLTPVILAIVGVWLLRRFATDDLEERWEKPVGLMALFVNLLAAFELISPREGTPPSGDPGGGGLVGWAIGELLTSAVGDVGSIVVLASLIIVCIVLVSDVSLAEVVETVRHEIHQIAEQRRQRELARISTQPAMAPVDRDIGPRGLLRRLFPPSDRSLLPVPTPRAPSGPPPRQSPSHAPGQERAHSSGQPSAQTNSGVQYPREVGAKAWRVPSIESIFEEGTEQEISQHDIRERVKVIEETLASFGIEARVREINPGPAVTQFGIEPGYLNSKDAQGQPRKVRVSRIVNLTNDLALALSASPIRIEAPIPGRPYVGIEVPNAIKSTVSLRNIMESEVFQKNQGALRFALGRDVSGQPVVADLAVMPHLLIAGATGSGKSVCINAIIAGFLATHTPESLRILMIDPKMVELIGYNGIPHLLAPVVVDLQRVVGVLTWVTRQMDERYKTFSRMGVRNLVGYNDLMVSQGQSTMPYIVVVIDELADLMMTAPDEVERTITRIAQMARATGIHLIIATQRPSVDVVTGLIKANFPARAAFAVTSQIDSRVILDVPGAERLLGRGDMLFMSPDTSKLQRLQGAYVSDREISRLVRFWKGTGARDEMTTPPGGTLRPGTPVATAGGRAVQPALWPELETLDEDTLLDAEEDDLLSKAAEVVRSQRRASVSLLQRRLRVGYARAARLIDLLEERGVIGPDQGGGRAREVLVEQSDEEE
jgi:S-DNA-T family DNA segregation ATPase FtsK/SpoIIIE